MRQHRIGMRLANAWTRLHVAFEIVGVKLYQPWRHIISAAIDGTLRDAVACGDFDDHTILDGEASSHHAGRCDDTGIGKCEGGHEVCSIQ